MSQIKKKSLSKILIETNISVDFQRVVDNFNRQLFDALKPPLMPLRLTRYDGEKTGDEVHLTVNFFQKWVSVITDHGSNENEWFFIDVGKALPWPFRYWKHVHKVIKKKPNESSIVDDISFSTVSGFLNTLIYPVLYLQFLYRRPAYRKYFLSRAVNTQERNT